MMTKTYLKAGYRASRNWPNIALWHLSGLRVCLSGQCHFGSAFSVRSKDPVRFLRFDSSRLASCGNTFIRLTPRPVPFPSCGNTFVCAISIRVGGGGSLFGRGQPKIRTFTVFLCGCSTVGGAYLP